MTKYASFEEEVLDGHTQGYFSDPMYAETMVDFIPLSLEQLGLTHLLNTGPFVDLGCGPGYVIEHLKKAFPHLQIIGIDGSPDCIKCARERVPREAQLIEALLEKLPLDDQSVAIAFSHKIYQLCNETTYPEIAREISRTLRTGGVYFAMEDMKKYKAPFLRSGLEIVEEVPHIGGHIIFKKR